MSGRRGGIETMRRARVKLSAMPSAPQPPVFPLVLSAIASALDPGTRLQYVERKLVRTQNAPWEGVCLRHYKRVPARVRILKAY